MESRSGNGRVLCSDLAQVDGAVRVALAIDTYFEPVAERLGYRRAEPVEVWLDPEWLCHATTFGRFVVFRPSPEALAAVEVILAHELVHWHVIGSPMARNLPHTVIEGVCDRVALELVPRWEEGRRRLFSEQLAAARERGELPRVVSGLGMSQKAWLDLPEDETLLSYALGFTLVDRIGVDRLRHEAERGPVSAAAILEMAGVHPNGDGL